MPPGACCSGDIVSVTITDKPGVVFIKVKSLLGDFENFSIPQGLNERFNLAAVQLLHDILTELLQKKIAAQPAISGVHTEHFRRVVLKEWFSIRLLAFLFGMIVP